jgi:nucleoid DNA-binding protein
MNKRGLIKDISQRLHGSHLNREDIATVLSALERSVASCAERCERLEWRTLFVMSFTRVRGSDVARQAANGHGEYKTTDHMRVQMKPCLNIKRMANKRFPEYSARINYKVKYKASFNPNKPAD